MNQFYTKLTLNEHLMSSSVLNVYCKDIQGKYLEINEGFKNTLLSPAMNESDVIGFKDRDLLWSEQASLLEANDQEVMNKQTSKVTLEPCLSKSQIKLFVSQKNPLFNANNKVIGVFGISFLLDSLTTLTNPNEQIDFLKHITTKNISSKQKNNLTRRQMECLFYLVKGMTVKQIAKQLYLSPKTVEHYLENIKAKMNCHSRSELVTKALEMSDIQVKLFSYS